MSQRSPGTTIWVDDETAEQVRKLANTRGSSIVALFREFVRRECHSSVSSSAMASVLGSERNSKQQPLPLSSEHGFAHEDEYSLDKWLQPDRTDSVVLMGTTMNRAIVQHEELWNSYLGKGKLLRVLLQGNLIKKGLGSFTPNRDQDDTVVQRRLESTKVLSRLRDSAPPNALELRNSGAFLITFSAIVMFRSDNSADIQIQPYMFSERPDTPQCARFVVNTGVNGNAYRLIAGPVEDLWQHSFPELRS